MSPGAMMVTGGGRGIGGQIALGAARGGAPFALLFWSRPDNASPVVDEIKARGGQAIAIAADVDNEADVVRAFEAVDDVFGTLGGVVNNVVTTGPHRRLADLPVDELETVFRTNVFGAFLCAREGPKRLSSRQGGVGGGIVMISWAHAVNTGAPGSWVHFAVSKGALETMSLGLAKQLAADGNRVNVVLPGVIATESRPSQPADHLNRTLAQVPMARMGDPAEVATAVLWLLSFDSSYVTGATLDVAGGP
jgi:NAD(P)-dependent dehydrogenase (short-subunit alcohol dehydrogenase family)